eukprot:CAMPEP_0184252340 /NCGR_PEP_ID=MMETSP0977-20130417/5934_1 /TAXON_ID=483370 /ORGANISM="non described non described, Strain CCMP2097" /LENGTH=61 /DNA_ID=CAMNT_0026557817 /DNA_START=23 /DNA_END=205 /DNA_ORIENTATION=+
MGGLCKQALGKRWMEKTPGEPFDPDPVARFGDHALVRPAPQPCRRSRLYPVSVANVGGAPP